MSYFSLSASFFFSLLGAWYSGSNTQHRFRRCTFTLYNVRIMLKNNPFSIPILIIILTIVRTKRLMPPLLLLILLLKRLSLLQHESSQCSLKCTHTENELLKKAHHHYYYDDTITKRYRYYCIFSIHALAQRTQKVFSVFVYASIGAVMCINFIGAHFVGYIQYHLESRRMNEKYC